MKYAGIRMPKITII